MDVTFSSGGVALAGAYETVPSPVAAALIITGSGRINRDTDAKLGRTGIPLLRTGVTKEVAAALAASGVATLRYDKRGVGRSGGDYLHAGLTENLEDARAGLHWLASQAPGLPLLTVGHSEGTLHAARLAAEENVAGTVLIAAPARTGEQVLDWQIAKIAPSLPAVAKVIMRLTRTDFATSQHKMMARLKATSGDVARIRGIRVNVRWYREFFSYDPAAYFPLVTCPVLAITGGHDMQVPPDDVDAIGGLVRGPFEGHVTGDLSHLLRPDPSWKGPRGYRKAGRQPVSPAAMAQIAHWVREHWAPASSGSAASGSAASGSAASGSPVPGAPA